MAGIPIPNVPMSETPSAATRGATVSPWALARGFARIGISGFGGVLPYARHTIVGTEHWLDDREWTEYLSQGQLLPGPNIVNIAAMLGTRFAGWRGALAALAGLMLPPFVVFLGLAMVYREIAAVPWIQKMLVGIAAVAAGLILGMAYKMVLTLPRNVWAPLLAVLAFVAVLVLHLPLPIVVLVLAPLGVACAWRWPANKHAVEKIKSNG